MNHDLPGYLSNDPIQKIVRTLRCISGTYLATTVSSIVYSKRILFLRIIMRSYKNQDGRTNRNFLHYFQKETQDEEKNYDGVIRNELNLLIEEKIKYDWSDYDYSK